MSKHWKSLAVASVVAASGLAATALYADSGQDGRGTMMGRGGMMGMMEQRGGMMDHCARMMGDAGSGRPNEQWRKEPPKESKEPERKG